MSHHFDTATAREDPRLNICDFYLFSPRPGATVVAMAVNAAATTDNATFHEEGLYAFRFDLDGDAREELSFKVRFDDQQAYQVIRSTEPLGVAGDVLVSGQVGEVADGPGGVRAYAGIAADMFFANRDGLHAFKEAFAAGTFDPAAFASGGDFFGGRNVTAIVLEVPDELIGSGTVHAWATVSLHGHAPEVQVSRWGLPLLTHFYLTDGDVQEQYNRTTPDRDAELFAPRLAEVAERMTTLAGSADNPAEYAKRVVARLVPTTLPYRLGTWAAFGFDAFNGRGFADNVMDVQLSLMTNTALSNGVPVPAKPRARAEFPYFGSANPSA
ncbi:MAG TPA: DUF4331 family protein [Pseudonocardiaceae bacterium]|jgi:hypothetical protein